MKEVKNLTEEAAAAAIESFLEKVGTKMDDAIYDKINTLQADKNGDYVAIFGNEDGGRQFIVCLSAEFGTDYLFSSCTCDYHRGGNLPITDKDINTYGMEFETSTRCPYNYYLSNIFKVESDSSISYYGNEFILRPLEKRLLTSSNFAFWKLIEKLHHTSGWAAWNQGCGIHLHTSINRSDLAQFVKNFCSTYVLFDEDDLISAFGRADIYRSYLNTEAQKCNNILKQINEAKTQAEAVCAFFFADTKRKPHKKIKEFIAKKECDRAKFCTNYNDKFSALQITPKNTLELRVGRATLNVPHALTIVKNMINAGEGKNIKLWSTEA